MYTVTDDEIFLRSLDYEFGWKIAVKTDEVILSYVEEENHEYVEKSKVIIPGDALGTFLNAVDSMLGVENLANEDYSLERSLKIVGAMKEIHIKEEFIDTHWRLFKISCDGSSVDLGADNLKVLITFFKKIQFNL